MIVNLFGLGAMVSLFLIYQQKSRQGILKCKLSADIFWAMHYFALGAWAGMIPNFVGIFRELIFVNREEKEWAKSHIWAVLFISFNLSLGILSFKNIYDVIPITASSFVTIALWINNPKLTKIISAFASVAFLFYDIFVASYMGIISETVSIISVTIYFFKRLSEEKHNV